MRVDIKKLLADPEQRHQLLIRSVIAIQAREGIVTSVEQAEQAVRTIQKERAS